MKYDNQGFKVFLTTRRTKDGSRLLKRKSQDILRSDAKGLHKSGRKIDLATIDSYINALLAYRDFLRAGR